MTLERDLRALAGGFPETPELAAARARGGAAASLRRRRRRRVAVLALALCLLVPATALGRLARPARPRARDLRPARRDGRARHAPARDRPRDRARLELGSRDLAGAGAHAISARRVAAPTALGAPDGIFEEHLRLGRRRHVRLRRGARSPARIGVAQARARERRARARSTRRSSARRSPRRRPDEPFDIDGEPALLLTGPPASADPVPRRGGGFEQTYTRLAGTTLLWQRRELLVRIEGDLPRAAPGCASRARLSTG